MIRALVSGRIVRHPTVRRENDTFMRWSFVWGFTAGSFERTFMETYQIVLLCVFGGLALLALLFLYLKFFFFIRPSTGKARRHLMQKYRGVKFAHRGLHDGGRAENSLSAFRAAVAGGYGIELDVRLCGSGELVVFHDATLNRVCGVEGKVIDRTAKELAALSLSNTGEGVPTFRQVLDTVAGAVPLLIEIKMEGDEKGIAEKLCEELVGYNGDYIVESFNPLALRIMKKRMPRIPRGILSTLYSEENKYKDKFLYSVILQGLYLNFLCRPDFIAYYKGGHGQKNLRRIRKRYKTPLFAWTVRSESEEAEALSRGFDSVIFENYIA